jgi:hypothetical protein
VLRHDVVIVATVSADSTPIGTTSAALDALPRRATRAFSVAGALMLVEASLLLASALLPWVQYARQTGPTLTVNALQFGAGDTTTLFGFILIGVAAALLMLGGAVAVPLWHPNVCMALIPTAGLGLEFADAWHGAFGSVPHATTSVGVGPYVLIFGLWIGVVASVLLVPFERVRAR